MRALIRGTEICLENAWSKWQRMNLLFLTGKEKDAEGNPLPGDGWTLDENYPEPVEDHEEPVEDHEEPVEGSEEPQPVQSTPVEEKPVEQPSVRSSESEDAGMQSPSEPLPETVTYGGKEYTLEELKKLIG